MLLEIFKLHLFLLQGLTTGEGLPLSGFPLVPPLSPPILAQQQVHLVSLELVEPRPAAFIIAVIHHYFHHSVAIGVHQTCHLIVTMLNFS